jgi:hypothetical protein
MVDYGITYSGEKPQEVEITENKVFIASDIEEVTKVVDDTEITEFQYNLVEYEKDEYIKLISDKNVALDSELTDLQVALCDVYELIG